LGVENILGRVEIVSLLQSQGKATFA